MIGKHSILFRLLGSLAKWKVRYIVSLLNLLVAENGHNPHTKEPEVIEEECSNQPLYLGQGTNILFCFFL